MGQIKEKNGQANQAITYYQQVSPSVEEYPEAMYSIGSIYAKAGQTDNEIKVYEPLIESSPKVNPYRIAALGRLAELYISQGKAKQAFAVYQDVMKNSADQTALANAKTRVDELQKVLE